MSGVPVERGGLSRKVPLPPDQAAPLTEEERERLLPDYIRKIDLPWAKRLWQSHEYYRMRTMVAEKLAETIRDAQEVLNRACDDVDDRRLPAQVARDAVRAALHEWNGSGPQNTLADEFADIYRKAMEEAARMTELRAWEYGAGSASKVALLEMAGCIRERTRNLAISEES